MDWQCSYGPPAGARQAYGDDAATCVKYVTHVQSAALMQINGVFGCERLWHACTMKRSGALSAQTNAGPFFTALSCPPTAPGLQSIRNEISALFRFYQQRPGKLTCLPVDAPYGVRGRMSEQNCSHQEIALPVVTQECAES